LDHLLKISWRYSYFSGCPIYLTVVLNFDLTALSRAVLPPALPYSRIQTLWNIFKIYSQSFSQQSILLSAPAASFWTLLLAKNCLYGPHLPSVGNTKHYVFKTCGRHRSLVSCVESIWPVILFMAQGQTRSPGREYTHRLRTCFKIFSLH